MSSGEKSAQWNGGTGGTDDNGKNTSIKKHIIDENNAVDKTLDVDNASHNDKVEKITNGSDKDQHDTELLKFADNYSSLLDNLDHHQHTVDNHLSLSGDDDRPSKYNNGGNSAKDQTGMDLSNDNGEHKSNLNGENLDMLLQHYQNVLTKPDEDSAKLNKFSDRKTCDYCIQYNKQCVYVPDLGNCIECETKRLKCTYDNGSTTKRSHEFVDKQETKKTKVKSNESRSGYYSNFLQSLNTSLSSSALSNQYEGISPGTILNTKSVERPQSQPQLEQSNKISIPPHSISQTFLKKQQQQQIQYPRSSFYVGPTSIYDISIIDRIKLDQIDQIQISKSLALRRVAPKVQFLLRDDYNHQLYAEQEQEVEIVERLVHPHGSLLVEIFFKRVHPYFPILHERVFLEKYTRSYRELTTPLLASIYSLALQWWDFHQKLIGFAKPDVVEALNEIAFKTFFERIERPKLSMIQTGLLILQCRSESPNNWVLCSNVVALAEELGLGVSCQDWKLPKWEKDLRKRLAWAVWATDKWTSLIEGRHSHLILGRNWMINILQRGDLPPTSPIIQGLENLRPSTNSPNKSTSFNINTDNLELYDMSLTNEDYQNGTLMFQQMVSLSIIVGEMMDTFYTQGAIHVNTNIEQVLKLAKPLQLKLREWYHSLPPQLSMNNFTPNKFNSNASLTLIYFAAEITLHRKIISSLTPNTPKELVQVCRTAAKTRLVAAIEFVGDLKNEHVNAFWYSCSTGNLMLIGTFAALLYVTAPTKDESSTFRDLMRNYIWVLRVRSKSFDKLRNALNNIHMLLAQIPGLLTDEEDEGQSFASSAAFRAPYSVGSRNLGGNNISLNLSNPVSQDLFNGLSNIDSNSFGNGVDMEHTSNKDNNFHHGSPSSYGSTPTTGNELTGNAINEHRVGMTKSIAAQYGDNQSPNTDNTSLSPTNSVHRNSQDSPKQKNQPSLPSTLSKQDTSDTNNSGHESTEDS